MKIELSREEAKLVVDALWSQPLQEWLGDDAPIIDKIVGRIDTEPKADTLSVGGPG